MKKMVILLVLLALIVLNACDDSAVEDEGIVQSSAYQFLHQYGWEYKDARKLDSPEEVTDRMIRAFWLLSPKARYDVFRTLESSIVIDFTRQFVGTFKASVSLEEEKDSTPKDQYFEYLSYLNQRYNLRLQLSPDSGEYHYYMGFGEEAGEELLEIREYLLVRNTALPKGAEELLQRTLRLSSEGYLGALPGEGSFDLLNQNEFKRLVYNM